MLLNVKRFHLVFLLLQVFHSSYGKSCSIGSLEDRCFGELSKFSTKDGRALIVKFESENELNSQCQIFDRSIQCVDQITTPCSSIDKDAVSGLTAAYRYMCTEGRNEFLQSLACLNQNIRTLQPKYGGCAQDFRQNLMQDKNNTEAACSHTKEMLNCLRDSVSQDCGKEAGDWQREFTGRALQPIYKNKFNCDLDLQRNSLSTSDILNIASIAFGVIAIISGILSIILYCRSKKNTQPRI